MGDGILQRARAPEGWETQSAVTVVAQVTSAGQAAVRALLDEMAADAGGNRILPLARLTGTHFARLFLTEAVTAPDGTAVPCLLVFMSDFDGPPAAHLERIVHVGGKALDELFGNCEGYPGPPAVGDRDRLAFLVHHQAAGGVDYVNTIGRTVPQVRAEAALYEALEAHVDSTRDQLARMTARDVRAAIVRFVGEEPGLRWALAPPAKPSPGRRIGEFARLVAPVAAGIVLLPVAVPALVIWLLVLRAHERRDPCPPLRSDPSHLTALRSLEDHGPQNQFTAIGFVKPGRLRRWTARGVLTMIGFGARHIFNRGNLAGVKTIHFARWIPVDGYTRIMFCSNFDGSTESYMDDFIDKVAWGLNAAFSNGTGYPATRWLIRGGARDEEAFKGFLRTRQLPTQVWYSAYPGSTALNIGTHARVRAGLNGEMDEREAQAWLRLL